MLGLALVAVFAFSAMLAVTASAETTLVALWLVNGATVEANLASHTTGEILLEDTKVGAAVVCSGILVGTVGAEGKDEITEVQNLAKETITQELVGLALLCETEKGCEKATEASPIEVWPESLPWPTLLFLMEKTGTEEFLNLVEKAAYDLLCLILGVMAEDLCSAADTTFPIVNSPLAETPTEQTGTPLATCTVGGAESGVNETVGAALITLVAGGELTVSSE